MLRSDRRAVGPAFLLFSLALLSACAEGESTTSPDPADATDGPLTAPSSDDCTPSVSDDFLASVIADLTTQVEALGDAGELNAGQVGALMRHLDNAARQLERRQYCSVESQLIAFRDQLDDFVGDGVLSDRQAYELRYGWRLAMRPPEDAGAGDVEDYAPGVAGEVRTATVDGETITYEVIDGLAIFNGDIILGYADEFEAGLAVAGPQQAGVCPFLDLICDPWRDRVVGWDVANNWGGFAENQEMYDRIVPALNHWEAMTGIHFERRISGQRIVFRNASGCSSWIGRQEVTGIEPQWVNLKRLDDEGYGCFFGSIVHEVGHALGLYHEQARDDRADYVRVHLGAVKDDQIFNFTRYYFLGRDIGEYDYGSIMHYGCTDFQKDGATENTVEPIVDGVTCDDIGQRAGVSEGDILGVYWLYPPIYSIVGATDGETRDRFLLGLDFETEPVRDDYIVWTIDDVVRGTGPTFSTVDAGLARGTYTIWATIRINGANVIRHPVTVTIANAPPVVDLGPDRAVDVNRVFSVVADVSDAEDGTCPPPACTYAWDPEPVADHGGVADYFAADLDPITVSVTVTDGFGDSDTDEVTLTPVDTPTEVFILSPADGATFSPGAMVQLSGYAQDLNYGDGPGPEVLPCGYLNWRSSDASDVFSSGAGCTPTLTLGDPGPRTLGLRSIYTAYSAQTEITVNVEACGLNCPPDVSFDFVTPAELDGASYDPSFSGIGYFLTTEIELRAAVDDADVPADNPVQVEWWLTEPCFGGGPCPTHLLGSGPVLVPANPSLTFTPSDYVTPWSNCVLAALPFRITVRATDAEGESREYARTVYLACTLI